MRNIITVSREFGSGGRTIAKALAKELGYEYFDGEMIERLVQTSEFRPGEMSEAQMDTYLWNRQRELILEAAERGNCVILGRGADYILRDHENALHVFVRADMPYRIDRILTHYGETEETPEQRIAEKDKMRKASYEAMTKRTWEKTQNYDLVLNSGKIGQERCIKIIIEAASVA